MKTKEQFFVEMTDTYGGEDNYCWVNRFLVSASTMLGAMRKVSKGMGCYVKCKADYGDMKRYDAIDACICFFVEYSDHGNENSIYSNVKTL